MKAFLSFKKKREGERERPNSSLGNNLSEIIPGKNLFTIHTALCVTWSNYRNESNIGIRWSFQACVECEQRI